jgi:hypothetical protein
MLMMVVLLISQSGGQAPYTYNIGSGNQNSNAFTGLTAGNYTVTITDNNACVTTVTCSGKHRKWIITNYYS